MAYSALTQETGLHWPMVGRLLVRHPHSRLLRRKAASATAGTSRRGPSEKHIIGGSLLWWIQLAVFQTRHRPQLAGHDIVEGGEG